MATTSTLAPEDVASRQPTSHHVDTVVTGAVVVAIAEEVVIEAIGTTHVRAGGVGAGQTGVAIDAGH